MELVSFAKGVVLEVVQTVAEQAASYRAGQTALRHIDRALWVVEKCARWAVPPSLDQDERPQPELVRPLPWVFFLTMLVALRVTRESISLINLILGKPPLRSADVVMYIQSKRRYLRTLKYQGNRITRSRGTTSEPWYSGLQTLLEFTMCFRRSPYYGNNNTTHVSNNDEVLVVKRKRTREPAAAASTSEATMERLIEKMMVDLDADSDDDSSFTLTNAASPKSLRSENSDSEEGTLENIESVSTSANSSVDIGNDTSVHVKETDASTPEKDNKINKEDDHHKNEDNGNIEVEIEKGDKEPENHNKSSLSEPTDLECNKLKEPETKIQEKKSSPKQESKNFIQNEVCSSQKQPSKQSKFGRKIASAFSKTFTKNQHDDVLANGRTMSVPNKRKGMANQRRDTDIPLSRVSPADDTF